MVPSPQSEVLRVHHLTQTNSLEETLLPYDFNFIGNYNFGISNKGEERAVFSKCFQKRQFTAFCQDELSKTVQVPHKYLGLDYVRSTFIALILLII